MKHIWGRGEMFIRFWWGNLRKRGHLKDPGVVGNIILGSTFRKMDLGAWTGSIWLRMWTGGWYL